MGLARESARLLAALYSKSGNDLDSQRKQVGIDSR